MRLWHYDLIPYLPDSQLIAQKRECDLIWKDISNGKKTNHILINYIWEYDSYKMELFRYYNKLYHEFRVRGFKFNNKSGYEKATTSGLSIVKPFKNHHNYRYLLQCFCNLQEKYDRGQKDFSKERYNALEHFVEKKRFVNNMEELSNNMEKFSKNLEKSLNNMEG